MAPVAEERPSIGVAFYVDEKVHDLRALLDERVTAVRREEELHRANLSLHLETLNHEAERLKEIVNRTVSRESYTGDKRLLEASISNMTERLNELRTQVVAEVASRAGVATERADRATWVAVAALVVSAVNMMLRWATG